MSVNFRNFGQAKQVLPKYLSDSLTPWWGVWTAVQTTGIAFDDLPPEPGVLARLYRTINAGDGGAFQFEFNTPQNLNGMAIEFWIKCTTSDPGSLCYTNHVVGGGFLVYNMYADNAYPIVWTKLLLPTSVFSYSSTPASPYRTGSLARTKTFSMYVHGITAPPVTLSLAGFNIRRL